VLCGESPQKAGFKIADCLAKSEICDALLHLSFFDGTEVLPHFYSFIRSDVHFTMMWTMEPSNFPISLNRGTIERNRIMRMSSPVPLCPCCCQESS